MVVGDLADQVDRGATEEEEGEGEVGAGGEVGEMKRETMQKEEEGDSSQEEDPGVVVVNAQTIGAVRREETEEEVGDSTVTALNQVETKKVSKGGK